MQLRRSLLHSYFVWLDYCKFIGTLLTTSLTSLCISSPDQWDIDHIHGLVQRLIDVLSESTPKVTIRFSVLTQLPQFPRVVTQIP